MVNFYIYYSGGAVKIDKNIGATEFYIYTAGTGIIEATGLPGNPSKFQFYWEEPRLTNYSGGIYPVTFYWDAPIDTGGGTIIAYKIQEVSVSAMNTPNVTGVIGWSGIDNTPSAQVYYGLGTSANIGSPASLTTVVSDSGANNWFSCGIHSYQIAAINSYGTGNYVNIGSNLAVENSGWVSLGEPSIWCRQNGTNTVLVSWVSGLVSCTGNYYQGEAKIYDNTGVYTGIRGNSVTPNSITVNISSLTKNQYYYAEVTEFHFVGVNPTGCSGLVPKCNIYSKRADQISNSFWYA